MIVDYRVENDTSVAIITDSHMDLVNVKAVIEKYENVICLGDITDVRKATGSRNDESISFFRENKIPCLRGNHEQFICDVKNKKVPFIYSISDENLEYLNNLPIGFRLYFPNGKNALFFHNSPKELGGAGNSPFYTEDFVNNFPINRDTTAVVTGHNHVSLFRGFDGISTEFIRCGSIKDGSYASIDDVGYVLFHNLYLPLVDMNFSWANQWGNYYGETVKYDYEALKV